MGPVFIRSIAVAEQRIAELDVEVQRAYDRLAALKGERQRWHEHRQAIQADLDRTTKESTS